MSPLVAAFIRSAAAPALLVMVATFFVSKVPEFQRARVIAGLVAFGFVIGHYLLIYRLSFPPADASESLSYVAVLLFVFVLMFPGLHSAPYLLRAIFVVGIGFLTLYHLGGGLLSNGVHQRNLLAFFFLGLGVWSILEKSAHGVGTISLIGLPLITATSLSFLLLFGGSASWSQMVSVLCAILGGLMALSWFRPKAVPKSAVVPFISVFLVAMMAAGHFNLEINPWKMIVISFPFLLLWIRRFLAFVPAKERTEFVLLMAMAGAPMAYYVWDAFKVAGPLY
ncbi:MAG: hypothetical protein AB7F86_11260 [Bdellovibrionales bacterium]